MLRTGLADAWCLLAGLQPASEPLRSFLQWSDAGVSSTPFFTPILRPIGPSQTESEPNEHGSYIVVNLTKFDRGFRESPWYLLPDMQAVEKPDADANGGGTAAKPLGNYLYTEKGASFLVTPDIQFFRDTVSLAITTGATLTIITSTCFTTWSP